MASNLVVLAVSSAAMLWFTPYLIGNLGLELYGLVPLALSLSTYMGVLTVGVQSAVGRYLTMEVANRDRQAASEVMSTAVGTNVVIALVIMPVLLGLAIASPSVFDVPAGAETDARWFFGLVLVSYVLVALREVVGAAAFSTNRMDLQNAARLTEVAVRVGFVVAAFSVVGPGLRAVGWAMLLGSLVSLLAAIAAWRFSARAISITPRLFNRLRLREMLGTGGWITVNHVGSLLHMATDLVVINLVLGSAVVGGYGSALQLSSFLRSFAGALSSVLAPALFAFYARRRFDELALTSRQAVKLLGLAIGLPTALVIGLARPVMGLWLGPDFVVLVPVVIALVFHLPFNYSALPLDSVNMAFDRVACPAIVGIATGVLNVGLSVLLAGVGPWALGVAIATAVSLVLRNGVFMPLYTARVLGRGPLTFFGPMLTGSTLALVFGAALFALERGMPVGSWPGLLAVATLAGMLYSAATWAILNAEDRALVRSLIPGVSSS